MNSKAISDKNLAIISKYLSFSVGSATCAVPYYNNRRGRARAKLRAQIGKGSPQDILDEVENVAAKEKVNSNALDSTSLKKFMVDGNIGIDCSGLVYHILNPKSLFFPLATGFIGKLRAKFRPAENASVKCFAHEKNSEEIYLKDVQPGDIITMINDERDHILLIHQVDYQDSLPGTLHYTHAVAWPTDGEYEHGVRQGIIQITDITRPLSEQSWLEVGKTGPENYTFTRAQKSVATLRRPLFLW